MTSVYPAYGSQPAILHDLHSSRTHTQVGTAVGYWTPLCCLPGVFNKGTDGWGKSKTKDIIFKKIQKDLRGGEPAEVCSNYVSRVQKVIKRTDGYEFQVITTGALDKVKGGNTSIAL